jgi:uncharacterized protein DUF4159
VKTGAAILIAVMLAAAAASAQRRGRFGYQRIPENPAYDGAFQFCRIAFRNAPNGDGAGWFVDWPRADENLTFRLSELTTTTVSIGVDGPRAYNHSVLNLTDVLTLSKCPFTMLTEPGGAFFDENEAKGLRAYLEHGGFLWADDFWGEYAWNYWENQIRRVLPSGQYPIFDVPPDHALFHQVFEVKEFPQIPGIGFWDGADRTYERADAKTAHLRAINDDHGRIMVLMTHNTDFGDSYEQEAVDPAYFMKFSVPGYAFGVNVIVYAMTH